MKFKPQTEGVACELVWLITKKGHHSKAMAPVLYDALRKLEV